MLCARLVFGTFSLSFLFKLLLRIFIFVLIIFVKT
nr:MAG TPA: hypothetical protein [Caudoviricetes sp.]